MRKTLNAEGFETEVLQLAQHIKLGHEIPNPQLWAERFSGFSHFLDSIDNTYLQSDKMVEMVNRSLEISTKELFEANEKFRLINKAMSAMVNSLDEGYLVIDQEGKCGQIVSLSAKNFLGREPVGEHLSDILNIPLSERNIFEEWLGMVFNEVIDFEDLTDLAPKHLFNPKDNRIIEVKFKPIRNTYDGKIIELVVIFIDISERVEAERKLNEQKLFTDMVIKYLNNKSNFIRVIQMSKDLAVTLSSWMFRPSESIEKLKLLNRELHTLKGGLNALSIYVVANKVHFIEEQILSIDNLHSDELKINQIRLLGNELHSCLTEFLQKNRPIFNVDNNAQDIKEISTKSIYKFSSELIRMGHLGLLKTFTEDIISVPFASMFAPIESNLHSQSMKQRKSVEFNLIDPHLIRVIPEFYNDFFEQMIHLFNNIMDHGMETDEERKAFRKAIPGKVYVELNLVDNIRNKNKLIQINIVDDGRGINPEVIRSRLAERGIDTSAESDEKVIYHIFDHGFSTRDSTTITSGRGFGMTAIMEVIQKMNGSIRVNSQRSNGTQFEIMIPYIYEMSEDLFEKFDSIKKSAANL